MQGWNQTFPIKPPGTYYQQEFNMTYMAFENTSIFINHPNCCVEWTLSLNNSNPGTLGQWGMWDELWFNTSVISPSNQSVSVSNFTGIGTQIYYQFNTYGIAGFPGREFFCRMYAFLDLSGNPLIVLCDPNSPMI